MRRKQGPELAVVGHFVVAEAVHCFEVLFNACCRDASRSMGIPQGGRGA